MRILLIDNNSHYLKQLEGLLTHHEVIKQSWDEDFNKAAHFDLVILSGGHTYSIEHHLSHYKNEIDFLKQNKKPLLGICLGAELIAHTFGAHLEMLDKREKGIIPLKIIRYDEIFEGIDILEVYENHLWAIKTLSEKLTGLAISQNGYEIFKHTTLPFYGFQFHPEMIVEKTTGKQLFTNLLYHLDS